MNTVSNILEVKSPTLPIKDWALYQIETSASWGGFYSSFFTGGLNYQIEHHLFPSLAHNYYYLLQPIIQEECQKNNIKYHGYYNLSSIFKEMIHFLYHLGHYDTQYKHKHL